jgi:hypothetical protein
MTREQHLDGTKHFVHGVAREVLIFIPREDALELAVLQKALGSPTWPPGDVLHWTRAPDIRHDALHLRFYGRDVPCALPPTSEEAG